MQLPKGQIEQLRNILLPGEDAQYKLAPKQRIRPKIDWIQAQNPRRASVLICLFPNEFNILHLVLTKRHPYEGVHSAQVSFPGGSAEPEDLSPTHTAIREFYEEVGVEVKFHQILRDLTPLYIPPSNFLVNPFLAYLSQKPTWKIDPHEVAFTMEVPLSELLSAEINQVEINVRGEMLRTPAFVFQNEVVWGATAMMLSELRELIQQLAE